MMKSDQDILDLIGEPSAAENAIDTISPNELARLLGISPRAVRNLAADGILERAGKGDFRAAESVQAYVRYREALARKKRSDGQNLKAAAEVRLKAAQADAAEMKAAAMRGELLNARDVEAAWAAILRDVRAGMLAVPGRVQQTLPHLTAHDLQTFDREIRDALAEMSGESAHDH